jgi:hypothetical protein
MRLFHTQKMGAVVAWFGVKKMTRGAGNSIGMAGKQKPEQRQK